MLHYKIKKRVGILALCACFAMSLCACSKGTTSDNSVVSEDGNVTKITKSGSYTLSGNMENELVLVDAKGEDVELVLDNVTMTSATGVAIYVEKADKVTITLAEDSTNQITTSGTYSDEKIDAAIFAKSDLVFTGNGTLTVTADASDAIYSKKDLTIEDGTYVIQTGEGATEVKQGDNFGGPDAGKVGPTNEDGTVGPTNEDGTVGPTNEDGTVGPTTGNAPEGMTPPDGNMPGGNPPDGNMPGGNPPDGNMPDGNMPDGNPPDGNMPGGNMPSGTAPDENTTTEDQITTTNVEGTTEEKVGPTTTEDGTVGPTITEETTEDVSMKGIKAKESINIVGGNITVNTEDDAIHSNGTLNISGGTLAIESGDDAIHAESDLVISGGDINITKCYEGIEGLTITVEDGNISVVSNDDGFNASNPDGNSGIGTDAACLITINGGEISIDAQGDGIDSNGNLLVNGGTVVVVGPTNGANSAIDYGDGGSFVVTGGEILAIGNSSMAENASSTSTQGAFLATLESNATGTLTITDEKGNELISYETANNYNSIFYSGSELTVGNTYTVTLGDQTKTVEMDALVSGESGGFMQRK